ncbi:MAG: polyphosphate polymerase domain-containing protein [Caldilinea sp.]|nr:polyphosphate polymerase domain-containing protein [Caldilinea sp.]MDW8438873.1 polyphosphate polymerase domain-containing protein [Caldilineaceae bacterium]
MADSLQQVVSIVNAMPAISLDEIKVLSLLDRLDVKFILHEQQLIQILERISDRYRVLEINGVRPGRYYTTYFDTPDFFLFHSHHNGLRVRHKVRWRWYIDSRLVFLEVKEKNNRERTVKTRTILSEPVTSLAELPSGWMPLSLTVDPAHLRPVVWNRFRRMTLADFERQERITIDIGIEFGRDEQVIPMSGLVIIEVKQRKFSLSSPIGRELHRLHLSPTHISKYCVSMAMLYPELRHNRFKPILRRLSSLCKGS